MTPPYPRSAARSASRRKATRTKKYVGFVTCAVVVIGAAVVIAVAWAPWRSVHSTHSTQQPVHYLGVYQPDAPGSYAGVDQFAQAIGKQPNIVSYYSAWLDPFHVGFAASVAKHGAVTLVQMDPKNVSLASIATGRYDAYLRSYAAAVKAFRSQVILSFGHEMNGSWYSWGYRHTAAEVFVKAWRHIVKVFRGVGARNVIWLWTVNVIDKNNRIPNPAPWWPGRSYVTWVGIDGYYYTPSSSFAQVFGPTIVDVRSLTGDPILIAETGASHYAGQSAKITDLFAGVQAYGLLGFLWFDADSTNAANGVTQDWLINTSTALAAFRRDAKAFMRPSSTPGPTPPTQHPSSGSSSP
jgi:mannan endo-1,4-beta-mannosidase